MSIFLNFQPRFITLKNAIIMWGLFNFSIVSCLSNSKGCLRQDGRPFFLHKKSANKAQKIRAGAKILFISALNCLNMVNFHFKWCFLNFFIFLLIFIRKINFRWILVTFSQSEKTLCKNKKTCLIVIFGKKKILLFF